MTDSFMDKQHPEELSTLLGESHDDAWMHEDEMDLEDGLLVQNYVSTNIIVTAMYRNGVLASASGSKVKAELIELNNVKVTYASGKVKFYPLDEELIWIEEGVPLTV